MDNPLQYPKLVIYLPIHQCQMRICTRAQRLSTIFNTLKMSLTLLKSKVMRSESVLYGLQ